MELFEDAPHLLEGRSNVERIELEGLSPDETEAMLDQLDGAVLAHDQRARLADAAEGNPLFVEQLLALALEAGLSERALPETIQALLAARLDRLGPGERAVLERGAVIGKEFARDDIAALLESDAAVEVVDDFLARVRERALSEEVMKSLTPGQQVVKVVNDELTVTMGGEHRPFELGNDRPVVIMLAIRGDRALLGRNRRRPGARFSCLAGFVEPGETPEEAVRREVREEAGVRCGRVRYLAAQPWPFPSSLMMGFLAEALTEEITVDPEEIAEARWFSRDEVREMVARAATTSGRAVVAKSISPTGRPASASRTAPPTMRVSSPSRSRAAKIRRTPAPSSHGAPARLGGWVVIAASAAPVLRG